MAKIWGGRWCPKMEDFSWLLLGKCILTQDNLQSHGMIEPSRCSLCKDATKTINHLLDEFPMAPTLWGKGEEKLRKITTHNGCPDITITSWPHQVFKNDILNSVQELFQDSLFGKSRKLGTKESSRERSNTQRRSWLKLKFILRKL